MGASGVHEEMNVIRRVGRIMSGPFTVGHEGMEPKELLAVLCAHDVDTLVDVRAPEDMSGAFAYHTMSQALMCVGIRYHYMGDVFAQSKGERFREGVARLVQGAEKRTLMLLGRPEDPTSCVRHGVARAVREHQENVWHVRVDGRVESLMAS